MSGFGKTIKLLISHILQERSHGGRRDAAPPQMCCLLLTPLPQKVCHGYVNDLYTLPTGLQLPDGAPLDPQQTAIKWIDGSCRLLVGAAGRPRGSRRWGDRLRLCRNVDTIADDDRQ